MPAYKYKTKTGGTKWYANFYYTDWKGVKQHKCKRGFSTRREAQEYERDFLNAEATDPDITFPSLVENFFIENENRLKPTTYANKKFLIAKHVLPYFKELKISEITPLTIHRWQNELIGYRDEEGNPYSPTYLRSINRQMSCLMNYAVRFYKLKSNPCRQTEGMGKEAAEEMHIWTQEQFQTFINGEEKPTFHLVFDILFYTGMRVGEMLALTPEDILETKAIRINKNYQVVDGKEYFLTPKTENGARTITIPESLYNELRAYIRDLSIEPDERLFYFGRTAVEAEMKAVEKKTGLPHIRVHDLRHSHASMLIQMNYSLLAISKRLGHSSPEVTGKIYSHLYPGTDRDLADDLDLVRTGEKSIENKTPGN